MEDVQSLGATFDLLICQYQFEQIPISLELESAFRIYFSRNIK